LSVAAGDARPAIFSAGIGSPVIIDSSTELAPSSTTPSTGTRSPGRTRRQSPARTSRAARRARSPRVDQARALRVQPEEPADRARGRRARAQLEHLADEHEH
jgi:hypothetical protein